MKRIITGRKMGLLAGTRVALGIGIGLLLSRRLSHRKSRVLGIVLTGAGAVSTIPLAIAIGRSPSVRDRKSAA